jgi:hypothetical protein
MWTKQCALCLLINSKSYAEEFVEMTGREAKSFNETGLQLSQIDGQRGNL